MGATFPVIAKFYIKEKIGKGIGEVYAANNLGAILGSFAAGFLLIPLLGIKLAIIIAGTINILIAFTLLSIVAKDFAKKAIPIVLVSFLIFAYFGNYNIQQMHSGGFYRTNLELADLGEVVYYKEGLYATVTVKEIENPQSISLFINGYGQGGTAILDLRVNFLMAYLPFLINPEIEESLVIGLGTGTTSGQLSQLTKVTTVELEPAIIGANNYFNQLNVDVLTNPSHKLVIADGRNYLLRNKEKYDLIVSEPTNTWQSFSTQLYSKEFFELVKDRLEDDGLFVKWFPIYTMGVDDFRNSYKTFNSVFPNVIAFANIKLDENNPVRYGTSEIIFVGSKEKIEIDVDKADLIYDSFPFQSKQYLDALRLSSSDDILNLQLFTSDDMAGYAADASLLTDDNPILEFSTARQVLYQNPEEIIHDIEVFLKIG